MTISSAAIDRTLIDAAKRYGAQNAFVEGGKTHPKLVMEFAGQRRMQVFSYTASDHRALQNTESRIKRIMRAMQLETYGQHAQQLG